MKTELNIPKPTIEQLENLAIANNKKIRELEKSHKELRETLIWLTKKITKP